MKDLAESCRKRGIKLGVYLSPADDQFGAGGGCFAGQVGDDHAEGRFLHADSQAFGRETVSRGGHGHSRGTGGLEHCPRRIFRQLTIRTKADSHHVVAQSGNPHDRGAASDFHAVGTGGDGIGPVKDAGLGAAEKRKEGKNQGRVLHGISHVS